MASSADLQSFLENLLIGFNPTIDLSSGSPAQTQVIAPIIERFSEDPLDTDISTFIQDRLGQEYPDLAADGGSLDDLFSKPLRLILESFKREIKSVKTNQSIVNADQLSDDETDALASNWFAERQEGTTVTVGVRLYFAAPTSVSVTTEKRVFTNSGLSFYPVENFLVSSAQMLFNRQGTLYYMDIVVQAEAPGNDYNVDKNTITGIDNVPGVVKVSNLSAATSGTPRQDNQTFLSSIPTSLTERSLVPKRGITSRLTSLFSDLRALQIVGAGEVGMNRDIVTSNTQGYVYAAGSAVVFGEFAVLDITYKDSGPNDDIVMQPGDLFRLNRISTMFNQVGEAKVKRILESYDGSKILLLLEGPLFPEENPAQVTGNYLLLKPGVITLSSVPGGILEADIPSDSIHIGGHTDIFVRPSSDVTETLTLNSISDETYIFSLLSISTFANSNKVTLGSDIDISVIKVGDLLTIDSGNSKGTYKILNVQAPDGDYDVRIDAILNFSETLVRGRVINHVKVNLVEPKTLKLPFDTVVSDLETVAGSDLLKFNDINLIIYGAKVGDIVRIFDGPDAGDYTILSFDGSLGGNGVHVDRSLTSFSTHLRYSVFTSTGGGISLPLVRVRSVEILDAAGQGTGITVPYGDAVDVRPVCDMEGAGKEITVLDGSLLVFPDMSNDWPISSDTPAYNSFIDSRYSQKLEVADGFTRYLAMDASNPITSVEINFPPFLWNGKRNKILALPNRRDHNFTADPAGTHYTSDLAEAKIGDSIVILSGPNQGKYLIKDHRTLNLWGASTGQHGHYKSAFIEVEPELKIDPLRVSIDYIAEQAASTPVDPLDVLSLVRFASNIQDAGSLYLSIINKMYLTFLDQGFNLTLQDTTNMINELALSSYSVGPSAIGMLRNYFMSPTSLEFSIGDLPTLFEVSGDPTKKFRPSFDLPPGQVYPQSMKATDVMTWPRDGNIGVVSSSPTFNLISGSFAQKGIRTNDLLQFHASINDVVSRSLMNSSWLCVTKENSNVVRVMLPKYPDNKTNIVPGQLFYIDSGPDTGAYKITSVITNNFTGNPPVIEFTIDKVLTYSTADFPAIPFQNGAATILTSGTTYPIVGLAGKTLRLDYSLSSGIYGTTKTHTFGAGPFTTATDVYNDINGDAAFLGSDLVVSQHGGEILISTTGTAPDSYILVHSSSTCVAFLPFFSRQVGRGYGALLPGGTKKMYHPSLASAVNIGDWVSIYAVYEPTVIQVTGDDTPYLGSFKIVDKGTEVSGIYTGQSYVVLDRTQDFPVGIGLGYWLILPQVPTTTPAETTDGGRKLTDDFVRCRLYSNLPETVTITVPWDTASVNPLNPTSQEQLILSDSPAASSGTVIGYAHKIPYRIIRDGSFLVSSTEMALNKEGALYYIELPVVGYGCGAEMNIAEDTSLFISEGAFIDGYTFEVENPVFTYSTKEKVSIILPKHVLPIGSSPSLDSYINLSGQNIQISYDTAPLVQDIQAFVDSPLDRVTTASLLIRHFLPSYVFLDLTYRGGSDTNVVAKDLISFINGISPDVNQLRADAIQDLLKRRGATQITLPILLVALTHDAGRKIRGLRSKNYIGGLSNIPPFEGTYKQMYFISGPDTSNFNVRPDGEQIYLVKS